MLRIGDILLDFPVIQAALSGYSDAPMRMIARRHGAPFCMHEVVLDKLVVHPGRLQKRMLRLDPKDHPIGGQIMGAEPEQFAAAAALLVEAGYDTIDVNFGCPVRKVLGRCRGGFLLSQPRIAVEILRRVRDVVPRQTPMTLKMRRGMDLSTESERDFFRILDSAFELDLSAVTVHGRTVDQRYVGPSDWAFLARVKRHAGDRVLIGSGDLFTADDIRRMLTETGVDGVAVARGCIGNPWIFEEARAILGGQAPIPPPSVPTQGRVIHEHYTLCTQLYGETRAARIMRKFGIKYAELHPGYPAVRDAFAAVKKARDWMVVLETWYDPSREWPPPRRRNHHDHLIAAGARL